MRGRGGGGEGEGSIEGRRDMRTGEREGRGRGAVKGGGR